MFHFFVIGDHRIEMFCKKIVCVLWQKSSHICYTRCRIEPIPTHNIKATCLIGIISNSYMQSVEYMYNKSKPHFYRVNQSHLSFETYSSETNSKLKSHPLWKTSNSNRQITFRQNYLFCDGTVLWLIPKGFT